ncbi:MAG: RNA methyltransferase [Cyanobacteria bacterium REEB65]|nr:RNA methyltransferase [Cyanobacteria bacterium REEB65]
MLHDPLITSVQNPRVKRVRRLQEAKGRRQEGILLLEGTRLVEEAQRSDWPIVELYATEDWLTAHPGLASLAIAVAPHVLAAMSTLETPEGVLALTPLPTNTSLPAITAEAMWVGCDRLQDPGNLGAILRTADAAGAAAVLTTLGTVDPYSPKVLRASMGSALHLPVLPVADLAAFRQQTEASGMRWAAAVPRAGQSLFDVDLRGPICWWLGSEAAGLQRQILDLADIVVEIPMPGRAESLNAAAAAAVCLFETVRQRGDSKVSMQAVRLPDYRSPGAG